MSQQILLLFIVALIALYFRSILTKPTTESAIGENKLFVKIILGVNILILITLILPWVNLPLVGSINGVELLSSSFASRVNETSLATMIPIGILSLVNIIGSIIQLKSNNSKKSFTKNFEILTGLLYIIIGYVAITEFKSFWTAPADNLFGRALSMTVSIGFGLYLIVIFGIIQVIICGIMIKNSFSNLENNIPKIQIDKKDIYNQLSKLHELKEKGLIDEVIFENERILLIKNLESVENIESNILENKKTQKVKNNFKEAIHHFYTTRKKSLLISLCLIVAVVVYLITINLLNSNNQNVFPYKISRELTVDSEENGWKALCKIPIYTTDEFTETIGSINSGENFTMLDDYYLIDQPILAKITNIEQVDKDCNIKNLKNGDEIKLVIGYGECQWSFIHNDSLKFATFGFDSENKKLIDCEYDGCTKIRGNIMSINEKKSFIVKIKFNGEIGWIKYILDDVNKYEFTDFIQSDY
jgi:hypothetical protein